MDQMPSYLATFAELYAISDLHMGGQKTDDSNFQIFNRGDRLAGLIDYVAAQRPAEDVALILNGDIIDSLAEETVPGRYVALDSDSVLNLVNRIVEDASFSMVWAALGRFVQKKRRYLVFVVGNHDIELALPVVEAEIRQRLTGSDAEASSRVVFSTHGAGFGCMVGSARVFCTHGNELDAMNWVDYNLLGQLANAMTAGRAGRPEKWKPNGGTRVVIDVMNIVKRNYPFIDLLKPETTAVAGVLVAIDKDTFSKVDLGEAFPILTAAFKGNSVTSNLLGADGTISPSAPAQAVADAAIDQLLGPNLRDAVARQRGGRPGAKEDDLLMEAAAVAGGLRPVASRPVGLTTGTLGARDLISNWVGLIPKVEALRRALKDWMKDDPTYEVTTMDNTYRGMEDRIADTVNFTITGHTHLARALRFPRGGYYYNCGTWIRLLRLTPQVLDDANAFEKVLWPALNARRMDALDSAQIPGPDGQNVPLVFDRTNAVRVSATASGVVGDLLRITGDSKQGVQLNVEPGTTSTKV